MQKKKEYPPGTVIGDFVVVEEVNPAALFYSGRLRFFTFRCQKCVFEFMAPMGNL